jgi:N-acetylglucosaminyldiphosphoundecaprenol N-acetyl-beta-D-mannosaminyltransferase
LKPSNSNYRQILGIRFFTGSAAEAVQIALRGGLVVVPAAPALVEIDRDSQYREALLNSDLALTDSGFMVLLWNLIKFEKIRRVSGLEYLKALVAQPLGQTLWVMPSEHSRDKALTWLQSRNVPVTENNFYVAPTYARQNITDRTLLNRLNTERPNHVIIALGGGVQEKLGSFLKQSIATEAACSPGFSRPGADQAPKSPSECDVEPPKGRTPYAFNSYTPGIHCIGAAIGFLSGDQVNIPDWADHLFLGWLFRCFSQPTKFFPRYWKARRLVPLLLKHRQNLPPLNTLDNLSTSI